MAVVKGVKFTLSGITSMMKGMSSIVEGGGFVLAGVGTIGGPLVLVGGAELVLGYAVVSAGSNITYYRWDRLNENIMLAKSNGENGTEGVGEPEIVLPSKPHANRTEGHWETILDELDVMKNSGDYKKIYVNKGLSNEIPGAKPNRRPDIMGVRHDGTIEQVEVPSKTDDPADLIERMIDNQRIIGDRAGTIKVRPIDK